MSCSRQEPIPQDLSFIYARATGGMSKLKCIDLVAQKRGEVAPPSPRSRRSHGPATFSPQWGLSPAYPDAFGDSLRQWATVLASEPVPVVRRDNLGIARSGTGPSSSISASSARPTR